MSRSTTIRSHGNWMLDPGVIIPVTPPPYTLDDGLGTNNGQEATGYVRYSSLAGATIFDRIDAAGANTVSVPPGTYVVPGFTSDPFVTAHQANPSAGLIGAGSDQTIITIAAQSSSGATYSAASGISNPYEIARIYGNGGGGLIQDFTVQGTPQTIPNTGTGGGNNTYGGITLKANNWVIKRVKILGIPGNFRAPPGETFGLSLFQVYGLVVMQDVEIDGQGVAASNFGTNGSGNSSTVPTTLYQVDRLYSHDSPYSGGFALWQTKFDPNSYFNDCTFNNNRCFWNVERCSGTVTLNRPRVGRLQAIGSTPTGIFCEADATWGAADSQAFRFIVRDPRNLDGTPYSGPKVGVQFGTAADKGTQYYGRNNFKCYDAAGTDISASFFSYGTGGFN